MGLKAETYFSQFCRPEVQDQGVSSSVSAEASLLDFQMAAFSLDPHMIFSLSVCAFVRVHPCVSVSTFFLPVGTPVGLDQGPS